MNTASGIWIVGRVEQSATRRMPKPSSRRRPGPTHRPFPPRNADEYGAQFAFRLGRNRLADALVRYRREFGNPVLNGCPNRSRKRPHAFTKTVSNQNCSDPCR